MSSACLNPPSLPLRMRRHDIFLHFFSFLSQRSVCSFVRSSGAHHPRHIVNPMQVLSFSVVFSLATKESEYKTRRVVVAGSRVECQDKHNCARKNKPKANRRGQRESDDRRGAPPTQTRARRAFHSGRRCPPHARMEASPPLFLATPAAGKRSITPNEAPARERCKS